MEERTPIITVVGSCNVDLISYVDHMPRVGETVKGKRFRKGFGGKGANQVIHLRIVYFNKKIGSICSSIRGQSGIQRLKDFFQQELVYDW